MSEQDKQAVMIIFNCTIILFLGAITFVLKLKRNAEKRNACKHDKGWLTNYKGTKLDVILSANLVERLGSENTFCAECNKSFKETIQGKEGAKC